MKRRRHDPVERFSDLPGDRGEVLLQQRQPRFRGRAAPGTGEFLAGVSGNNEKSWFEANRPLYEQGYVAAGRAFVEAIGPELRKISPGVGFEPKIGASMMRVNRDIRFTKDKRPYKDHLDLWFWHGENKGWAAPGFFLRLTPSMLWLGTGMHAIQGDQLTRFRHAIADDTSGAALVDAIETVRAAGPYVVGGKTRRQVPRGFDKDHERAEYFLYEALYAHYEAPAEVAYDPGFGAHAIEHFRSTWPIARWLLEHVATK